MVADLDVLVDDHVRADVGVASNLRRGMNDRRGMHSRGITQRLVEEFEGAREAEIRILDAQCGGRDDGKVLGDDDRCGFGEPRCGGILGIRDECDFSWAGLLDAIEAGDVGIGWAVFEACVEGGGDLRKFHGRWMDAGKSYTSSSDRHPPMFTFL